MRHHKAKLVYRVARDGRPTALRRLRTLPSGALVAIGIGVAARSFDEGRSWYDFGEQSLNGEDVVDVSECDGWAIAFTKAGDRTRIWRGSLERNEWTRASELDCGWLDYATVISDRILVAAIRDPDNLQILFSSDAGETWKRSLRLETSGSLNLFSVNRSGIGVAVFLTTCEMLDGADFESTVVAVDVGLARVLGRKTFRANVQSVFGCSKHAWLLGASSGLLFSYDTATNDIQTRAALANAELNVVGIHLHEGKLALIAEESDPPGRVWMVDEVGAGRWSSFRTGIDCYVSDTAAVGRGIIIAADHIYTLDWLNNSATEV